MKPLAPFVAVAVVLVANIAACGSSDPNPARPATGFGGQDAGNDVHTGGSVAIGETKTGGIAAALEAVADSDHHTKVTATLRVGGMESNTYVILDSGDSIQAKSGTETRAMYGLSEGVYSTDFATDTENREFRVELLRGDKTDTNATDNVGTLPKPFALTVPTSGPSRASDDIAITWTDSGSAGPMKITIEGLCIFDFAKDSVADTGSLSIPKGQLASTNSNKPESCPLSVTMERRRAGSTDRALDSESRFVLTQRRIGLFNSAP
jgi:hypothetical protein